jgi:hypothetical protein
MNGSLGNQWDALSCPCAEVVYFLTTHEGAAVVPGRRMSSPPMSGRFLWPAGQPFAASVQPSVSLLCVSVRWCVCPPPSLPSRARQLYCDPHTAPAPSLPPPCPCPRGSCGGEEAGALLSGPGWAGIRCIAQLHTCRAGPSTQPRYLATQPPFFSVFCIRCKVFNLGMKVSCKESKKCPVGRSTRAPPHGGLGATSLEGAVVGSDDAQQRILTRQEKNGSRWRSAHGRDADGGELTLSAEGCFR